jgi:tetratricopeptide (TPR) repeat protein
MIGATLGPYRLSAELGAGAMGTVYRATVESADGALAPGTTVAVKVVHAHLLRRPVFLERFAREEEIGKRVVHANVVRTLDAGATLSGGAELRFLVMEYVEGRTLRALADELGRVPEELCRHVGREAAKGLAAIHAAGIVHRDVKPDNVLITKDHVVKVMDLGVARLEGDAMRLSQSGAFVGSMRYAAPEQIERAGRVLDGRADLHALGLVLYELATATHPFVAVDVPGVIDEVLHKTPRRAGEVNPQLSAFFDEVLDTLLAKNRDARFASADDLVRVLTEGEESAWWTERSNAIRARTRHPLRRIRIARETSLHGRESELATLRRLYEKARAGEGAVLLVEGEAGIGKSRLVDEFVARLERAGEVIHCLVGGYPPGGAATSSGAFSTAYREHFGEGGSARWLSPAPILVPAFDALLRGEPAPAGAEPLTKDSLQTCFVHATRVLAADRATIVVIDDLHFAPQEGRALFAALAHAVPGHRVLLIGTTRPGLDERWLAQIERIGATRLSVPRLGAPDLVRLLAESLRSQHLAEELAGKIAVKSDGNPFFVFEILRGLREGQFITKRSDGTWATTREIRDIEVPSSIVELVQARVSDLSRADRNALEAAACVGFQFDPTLVADVLKADRIPLLQTLGGVEKTHRLVRSVGRKFVFDHHQVMEVLYAGLSEPLREEYHAAIGSALEARSGAAAKAPADLDGALRVSLADHYLRGASGARALRYLDAALTHLESNYLNDDAVRLADRALASPGLLAGRERAEMCCRKADRLEILGRTDAERAALDEAVSLADLAGDPELRARVRTNLGVHLLHVGRAEEAESVLLAALEHGRATGDKRRESAATGNLGLVSMSLGRYAEARERFERCLALARELGIRRGEAGPTMNLGILSQLAGRYAESREHFERRLALAREMGDRRGEGAATGGIGSVLLSLGRIAEAREHYERGLALARDTGDRRREARALGNLGMVYESLGRFAEAREHQERHLALAQETGYREEESVALANLGRAHLRLGAVALARRRLEESVALCRETGARAQEVESLAFLGEVAVEEGDAAAALPLMEKALARYREIGDADSAAGLFVLVADLRRRAGETESARTLLTEALQRFRADGHAARIACALALLACLPGGDPDAAVAALAEAGVSEHVMLTRWFLWQATRDPAHLAQAKRRLDFLVEHAPADCRESMLANVRLHREIVAAARASGVAP